MNLKHLFVLLFVCGLSLNTRAQCKAKINYTIQNDTVQFYSDSSLSAYTPLYLWDFGNGNGSTFRNPRHIFKNGTFSICLVINDTLNKCSDTACVTLTIFVQQPCRANFTWIPSTPNFSKPVIWFSDSSSNVYSKFTFGDNSSHIRYRNMTRDIFHTYDTAGTYTVCLFVYDLNSKGDTVLCDSICKTVVVRALTCNAHFTHAVSGKTVTLRTTSTGNFKKITWFYGDGKNYTRNVDSNDTYTYTYSKNGNFVVYLYLYDSTSSAICSYYMDTIVIKDTTKCTANYTFVIYGDSVIFTNTSTGNWKSERWSMGDGKIIDRLSTFGPTFLYIYKCKGNYSPRLSLYENTNYTNFCSDFFDSVTTSGKVGCNANFTYSTNKNTVVFTTAATGSYCYEYWDFGDSTSSYYERGSATNITHSYAKLGTYTVCYKLYDNSGICSQTCKSIIISQLPGPCTSYFTYYQPECTKGDSIPTVQFTSANQSVKNSWNFGDGTSTTGNAKNINHTYKTAGTYTVCLYDYYIDSKKDTVLCDSICSNITVESYGNIGKISSKVSGDTVVFTNLSLGNWKTEFWDFGDGDTTSTFTGKNGTITHIYKKNGIYFPYLKINDFNKKSMCSYGLDIVFINKPACQASYYLALDTSTKFNLYLIQNSKGTTNYTKYFWSFGDGDTSHSKSPTHRYKSFGLYNLCLTISDSTKNCTSTYCDSIGLDSNGRLLKTQGFNLIVFDEKDVLNTSDKKELKQIQIYPNPSTGVVNISIQSDSNNPIAVEVFNALGQSLISKQFEIINGPNQMEIALTNQKNGIYFVQIRQSNQTITKRVLIQNN